MSRGFGERASREARCSDSSHTRPRCFTLVFRSACPFLHVCLCAHVVLLVLSASVLAGAFVLANFVARTLSSPTGLALDFVVSAPSLLVLSLRLCEVGALVQAPHTHANDSPCHRVRCFLPPGRTWKG